MYTCLFQYLRSLQILVPPEIRPNSTGFEGSVISTKDAASCSPTTANSLPSCLVPIFIKGFGESSSHSSITYMNNLSVLEVAANSSKRAYNMSGMRPKNIDFAMIYDSFTITVLMTLESLGFCEVGEGKDFVKQNALGPKGHFPINTNGGGLSYCHPGMYSIFTIIEGCRQIWKVCGKRQLKKEISNVLCHGTGGVLSSAATIILSKEK